MGLKFNKQGFVIRQATGVVTHDSRVSAATGKRVGQAGVIKAVPNTDGLYLRLHRNDEVKGQPAKQLYEQARAWYAEQQAIADSNVDPDGSDADDPDSNDNE